MRLNNKNILTEKQFKENFSFIEVWEKPYIVLSDLKGIAFADKEKKDRFLTLINVYMKDLDSSSLDEYGFKLTNCFNNGLDINLLNENFHFFKNEENDKNEQKTLINENYCKVLKALYSEIYRIKVWSRNKRIKTFCIILALHCLADVEIRDVEGIVDIIFSQKEQSDIKDTCINLENSDIPYKLPCFDFRVNETFEIIVKKIINISDSRYGIVKVHVIGEEGCVIQFFELKPKESMYINTINDQFVQAIPNISASNKHVIYRCISKESKVTLKRINFKNNREFLYDTSKLDGLTQFTADDDSGFIAIVNDKIEPYINMNFEELYYCTEKPVWVCINGSQYIVLTNKGELITNFALVKGWRDIIAIYFFNNTAFAITKDGRVLSTNKDISTQKWRNIIYITACENIAIGMSSNCDLYLHGCHMDKKLKGNFHTYFSGYVELDEDNNVCLNEYSNISAPMCILNNIKEIAVSNAVIVAKDKEDTIITYNLVSKEVRNFK